MSDVSIFFLFPFLSIVQSSTKGIPECGSGQLGRGNRVDHSHITDQLVSFQVNEEIRLILWYRKKITKPPFAPRSTTVSLFRSSQ